MANLSSLKEQVREVHLREPNEHLKKHNAGHLAEAEVNAAHTSH
jgi:hypothetical protein